MLGRENIGGRVFTQKEIKVKQKMVDKALVDRHSPNSPKLFTLRYVLTFGTLLAHTVYCFFVHDKNAMQFSSITLSP